MHFSDEIARQVMRSGARGYVLKTDSDAELLDAIQNLREGRPYYTGRLANSMAQSFVQGNPAENFLKWRSAARHAPQRPRTPNRAAIGRGKSQ